MNDLHIKLFHNSYRHVNFYPTQGKLVTTWFGQIPEKEYVEYIDFLNEAFRLYEIKHLVINTKKAKSHFWMPSRALIEQVLIKANKKGAETLTLIQKKFGNAVYLKKAYEKAIKNYGIDMDVAVIEPTSQRMAA